MKLVSFDFDSTLSRKDVQEFALELSIRDDVEIWICTSRLDDLHASNPDHNKDLWEVALSLGIPPERVIFTNLSDLDKAPFIAPHGFVWHLDDDPTELRKINKQTSTVGISSWGTTQWRKKCLRILDK